MSITQESLYNRWGGLLSDQPIEDTFCASGFDHPAWPVICADNPAKVELLRWGLIPFWVKDDEKAARLRRSTLNARGETLFEKPSFRSSISHQRCLILVDGFFEPHKHEGRSYPFYCYKRDHRPFAIAGLYSSWTSPADGTVHKTFSLITSASNELMSIIHNEKRRMPAILRESEEELWLDRELDRTSIEALIATKEFSDLTAHPVSQRVSTRNPETRNPETQTRVEYPELAHLALP